MADPEPPIDSEPHVGSEADTEAGATRPRRRLSAWALAPLGALLGVAIGLGLGALDDDDDGDDAPTVTLAPVESLYPDDQVENADALLAAWDRYRNATFRAELTFERVVPGGESLTTSRVVVQQPPRRAVREQGSVSVIDDDETLVCDTVGGSGQPGDVEEATVCTEQATSSDHLATVAFELAAWRTAIGGDRPAYAVTRSEPGCFELQLVRTLAAPPYGATSRLCFDETTGVLQERETVRESSTDREVVTDLSATVTDADWAAIGAG